jgi:site-specific DNA recombinase
LLPSFAIMRIALIAFLVLFSGFEMLRNRKALSITDIASAEKLPRTYVGSVIPFALLAPDITEAILEGTQPIDLNLDRLINVSLPIDWAEQRSVLGFR